ncbi:unnamed protein product [[Actinomadura] parvosata subsp. kistnae]|uniref:Uncharacterized protein n=1 Tax=[Actinomadura] parvosata subsp. kistnae TaxID=1909395 RepID=A0A1V0AID3_9ACTN|nr:carboxypeptidase-like regulatory domain-containing protein [Nonomuraea sp. ATCC 55076]AQZ69929.1 hypothetical protein BKM31_58320 [Nonomuraea sp. ATCC 55076]SPL90255.1 unnamed protein product [Actinomadura parvosata subsp. kistnae]
MINDEYFLAALRLEAGTDPIPLRVSSSSRDVWRLRLPHAVTATQEATTIRSVRADDSSHLVRFVATGLTFDLEVTEGDGLIDVAGHISPYPGEGALVDVRSPHLTLTRRITPNGHFAVTGLPPGWLSVVCHRPGHLPVQTTWVRIRP